MIPIYLHVDSLPLKIMPEIRAVADGHPVLTYTYYIFKDIEAEEPVSEAMRMKSEQLTGTNPDYYGYIIFEQPGKVFTYTSNETYELESEDIEQIIEQITHYRDNPDLWKLDN